MRRRKPTHRLNKVRLQDTATSAEAIDAREASDAAWLAQNYSQPAPLMEDRPSVADLRRAAETAAFNRLLGELEHNETPDPLGKTGQRDPKSIHDPAPSGRIQFVRPKRRKPRDPYAVGTDCMLPDDKRSRDRHLTFVDDAGAVTARVRINEFNRRITSFER